MGGSAALQVQLRRLTLQNLRSSRWPLWQRVSPCQARRFSSTSSLRQTPEPDEADTPVILYKDSTEDAENRPVTKVTDRESAARALEIIKKLPPETIFACDTETIDLDVKTQRPVGNGKVICASIFAGEDIDFGNGPRLWVDNMDDAEGLLMDFRDFFQDPSLKKVWHNYGFDRHVLFNHDIDAKGFAGDTMHMARLWDTSRQQRGGYSLEHLTADLIGIRKVPMKERFGVPKKKKDGSDGKVLLLPPLDELQRDLRTRDLWIDYSCFDAESTWLLHEVLKAKLEGQEWNPEKEGFKTMYDFYVKYYVPFGECLTDLEREGIFVNLPYLKERQLEAEKERQKHEEVFLQWAGEVCPPDGRLMNVGSDAQKQTLLFAPCANAKTKAWMPASRAFKIDNHEGIIEEGKTKPKKQRDMILTGLGLKSVESTSSGWPAVSAKVLKQLAGDPFASPPKWGLAYSQLGGGERAEKACRAIFSLVEMSSIDTMLQTFLIPLQELADDRGRVHCSLNLNTETGRLSSRQPNLQNQPALEKDRYKIRQAFMAEEGKKLIVADYGQLELRVLAHITNCKSMIEAFKLGGDFHSRTAMGMYEYIAEDIKSGRVLLEWDGANGPPPVPLLKDKYASERRKAKVLNFSIAYGKTAHGLAQDFGVPVTEAQGTVDKWYADRPEVKRWQEMTIAHANQYGYTYTFMRRRRHLPDAIIRKGEKKKELRTRKAARGHSERAAINTPIQGSAADIVMAAMLKIRHNPRLRSLGWRLLLQIHDEVILEGPEETAEEALKLVREDMERPFENPLRVDLVVDAKIAKTWYEAK